MEKNPDNPYGYILTTVDDDYTLVTNESDTIGTKIDNCLLPEILKYKWKVDKYGYYTYIGDSVKRYMGEVIMNTLESEAIYYIDGNPFNDNTGSNIRVIKREDCKVIDVDGNDVFVDTNVYEKYNLKTTKLSLYQGYVSLYIKRKRHFLHKIIMEDGLLNPTNLHRRYTFVNGNKLDCRRWNIMVK